MSGIGELREAEFGFHVRDPSPADPVEDALRIETLADAFAERGNAVRQR